MDVCESLHQMEEDRDSVDLEEFASCSSSTSSYSLDSLELEAMVVQLTSEILHTAKKEVELEDTLELEEIVNQLTSEILHTAKEELELEVGQLPGSCIPVEFAGGEETKVRIIFIEEEGQQEPLEETKSWWRRLWKGMKAAGNFCLGVMRCLTLRCMRQVVQSDPVLPI